jgi:hypothetical protein
MARALPEFLAAIGAVLVGLGVAIVLAPSGDYFLINVAFFWGSQLAVLLLALLLKPRSIAIAGIAFAVAVYLAAFGHWLFTRTHPESMAWFGYVFSLPGALLGAWAANVVLRRHPTFGLLIAGAVSTGLVLVGIAANQVLVCSTIIYCGGK